MYGAKTEVGWSEDRSEHFSWHFHGTENMYPERTGNKSFDKSNGWY
jgi:hypothetical protein